MTFGGYLYTCSQFEFKTYKPIIILIISSYIYFACPKPKVGL